MTEDEAKTKWCPQARTVETGPNGNTLARNRVTKVDTDFNNPTTYADSLAGARCIASACMAWRWLPNGDNAAKIQAIRDHREKYGSSLVAAKDAVEAAWVETSDQGFCGLAGGPR